MKNDLSIVNSISSPYCIAEKKTAQRSRSISKNLSYHFLMTQNVFSFDNGTSSALVARPHTYPRVSLAFSEDNNLIVSSSTCLFRLASSFTCSSVSNSFSTRSEYVPLLGNWLLLSVDGFCLFSPLFESICLFAEKKPKTNYRL